MKIINKKAMFDYQIIDRFEAGIALLGCEVKSIRAGHAKLDGAFVRIIGGEAQLVNSEIYPYQFARLDGYDPKRTRKLLVHKKEILSFLNKTQGQHLTLIPMRLYTKGPIIKLEVGVGKGKKEYDKRESIKNKDLKRELERRFRGKVK